MSMVIEDGNPIPVEWIVDPILVEWIVDPILVEWINVQITFERP